MNPEVKIEDLQALLGARISWRADPEDSGWLMADHWGGRVYMRLNNFPEENIFSLWLGNGRWFELEEPPSCWEIGEEAFDWPESARPKLPKGQFHEVSDGE
jgi:hypothetical protein